MKVYLINPPDELGTMLGTGIEFVQKFEPLGLLYIAAVARENGHEVSVIDAYAEGLSLDAIQERIDKGAPDVVGISTLTCSGAPVFKLGGWLKRHHPGCLVVLGNIHASVFAEAYLKNRCCDIVVHGEGEFTFLKILEARASGARYEAISSVSLLNDKGDCVTSGPPGVVEDLAALPLPARDLLNQKLYTFSLINNQNYLGPAKGRSKTMITSRGCRNRCSFCVAHQKQQPRYNSAARVAEEMELLEKSYKAAYVYIQDPYFLGDPGRVEEICAEIRRRGLKIGWGFDAHPHLITPRIVRLLESANCREVSLGIESGVQSSLDSVNKKITPEAVRKAVRILRGYSAIKIEGMFILGLPGETRDDILKTIAFATSLPLDMAQFSVLCPYPGSPLFSELSARGELDTGIRDGNSVDLSVWKKYSSYICFNDNDPAWVTPGLTAGQLRSLQKKALRAFYLRPGQLFAQLRRLRLSNAFKALKIAFKGFF